MKLIWYNKMFRKLNIYIIFILTLVLNGCMDKNECYLPDDFGMFSQTSVSADKNIKSLRPLQISNWQPLNDGYVSGGKLIIVLQNEVAPYSSSWTSWYGISTLNNISVNTSNATVNNILNYFVHSRPNTTDFANNLKAARKDCQIDSNNEITNSPCVIKNGLGLYVSAFDTDPTNLFEIESPETIKGAPVLHLGQGTYGGSINDVILYNDYPPAEWMGKKLYFRFLDTYYQDNLGSYNVTIKSGLTKSPIDPIAFLISKVREVVLNTVEAIYKSLIKDYHFQNIVNATLLIFIVIYSLMFIMGMVRFTAGDLAIKGLKVGIISVAMSDNSWAFYNKILFKLFTDGTGDLISIISGSRGAAEGIFIDTLSLVFNPVVPMKILSIMFASALGFGVAILFFIIFIIILVFLFLALIKAVITYVTALMIISFMITLFPIFIVSILFQWTMNKLFNEWLKIIAANAIQAFIIIAIYIFFKDVVTTQFQKVIGFKACWRVVGPDYFPISIIRPSISRDRAKITVPGAFYNANGKLCSPYTCEEERYVDIPFLKPGDLYNDNMMTVVGNKFQIMSMADAFKEMLMGNDQPIIDNFFNYSAPRGKDVALLLGIVYCFYVLVSYAVTMANFISGQSFSWGGGTAAEMGEKYGSVPMGAVTGALPNMVIGGIGGQIGKLAYKGKDLPGKAGDLVVDNAITPLASKVKQGAKKVRDVLKDL